MINLKKSDVPISYTLVLTACIDPVTSSQGKLPVKRRDPKIRLQDYCKALKFWFNYRDLRIQKIIFIDNSGYSLDTLIELVEQENIWQRKYEFISMNNNEIIDGLSYGYSEFKLLDEGLKRCTIIEDQDYIIKSTGRYIYPNISKLLTRLPSSFLFAADSVDFYSLGFHKFKFIKFRSSRTNVGLFISQLRFYNVKLRKIYKELVPFDWKEKAFIETWLFKKLNPLHDNQNIILRFPCNCYPVGIGGNNTNYSSYRHKVIRLSRGIGRVIMPSFWF